MSIYASVDTRKFDVALKAYAANTKKDIPSILNTKMYFIARQAIANTRKADAEKVKAEMEQSEVHRVVITKTGKVSKSKKNKTSIFGSKYNTQENSRIAKILNARRVKAGKKTLHGDELLEATRKAFGSRMRSITFLKSGWLPALYHYHPLAFTRSGPPIDRAVKIVGANKGGSRPATTSNYRAEMWNNALESKHATKKSGAIQTLTEGLQKGFDAEARSMDAYVKQKLAKANEKFNNSQK